MRINMGTQTHASYTTPPTCAAPMLDPEENAELTDDPPSPIQSSLMLRNLQIPSTSMQALSEPTILESSESSEDLQLADKQLVPELQTNTITQKIAYAGIVGDLVTVIPIALKKNRCFVICVVEEVKLQKPVQSAVTLGELWDRTFQDLGKISHVPINSERAIQPPLGFMSKQVVPVIFKDLDVEKAVLYR